MNLKTKVLLFLFCLIAFFPLRVDAMVSFGEKKGEKAPTTTAERNEERERNSTLGEESEQPARNENAFSSIKEENSTPQEPARFKRTTTLAKIVAEAKKQRRPVPVIADFLKATLQNELTVDGTDLSHPSMAPIPEILETLIRTAAVAIVAVDDLSNNLDQAKQEIFSARVKEALREYQEAMTSADAELQNLNSMMGTTAATTITSNDATTLQSLMESASSFHFNFT
ncbi:MAG: hypothetical protein K2W97_02205 [Chthoniobacterales bacterium]|nr:hypothetical protein [Chthoniobacterales bacterium]